MSNVVITGAAGFIGSALARSLASNGMHVVAVVRRHEPNLFEGMDDIEVVECPLDQISQLAERVQTRPIDAVFHFAWAGASDPFEKGMEMQLLNINAACELVHQTSKMGCSRFVYAGTMKEYDALYDVTHDGIYAKGGVTLSYSRSKLAADLMCRESCECYGVEYICALISNLYGPGDASKRFLNQMLRRMLQNVDLDLTEATQPYDFVFIDDAIRALTLLQDVGESGESYYVGNPEQRPLRDYLLEAKDVIKSSSSLNFGAVGFSGTSIDFDQIDVGRMQRELNFAPSVSFGEGVLKTIEWIQRDEQSHSSDMSSKG